MKPEHLQQLHGLFLQAYPGCSGLKILPAIHKDGIGLHDAYDIDDVAMELGPARFERLIHYIIQKPSSLVSHGHRHWPKDHAEPHKRGAEVHCIRATDLEAFLKGGG